MSAQCQALRALGVSIPSPVDLEQDADEKVCTFMKVNDCFVGPLKAFHKIKGNLPEGFVL